MAAIATAVKVGVDLIVTKTSFALEMPTAVVMAPPLTRATSMAAFAAARLVGVDTAVKLTSVAKQMATKVTIAMAMGPLRILTRPMVVFASVRTDGKVQAARPR